LFTGGGGADVAQAVIARVAMPLNNPFKDTCMIRFMTFSFGLVRRLS
jgi:hypothetical protein